MRDSLKLLFIIILFICYFSMLIAEDTIGCNCKEEIDRLLFAHDLCERGYQNPDSAGFYTVAALQLADSCYGFDSKEYMDIFTDYMIHDVRESKDMVCGEIYTLVTQVFNPFTPWIWRTYYRLGIVMEALEEYSKAKGLFEKAKMADIPSNEYLKASIHATRMDQQLNGGNLESMLEPLIDSIQALDKEEQADVAYLIARYIAEYYIENNNDEKALEFIEYGERLTGHINVHNTLMLLEAKYRILLKYDHLAAVECLDRAIELAKTQNEDDEDTDWIAMALVDRGDYALNEQLDIEQATHYYLLANELNNAPMAFDNPVKRAIVRRIIYILNANQEYERAIQLGELLVRSACRNDVTETSLWYVVDLADSYIAAGQTDKAYELMSRYDKYFILYPECLNKADLQYARYYMAIGNYHEASAILSELLKRSNLRRDTKMWAERSLAEAYSKLGDPRMEALSDSINLTTKRHVAEQIWFISPLQRHNWLKFCEEALVTQLDLPHNPRAISNAANLNLFKKNILFRTSSQIENFIAIDPMAKSEIEELKKLRRELRTAITKGDSISATWLRHETDEREQIIFNRHVNPDLLLKQIDVDLHQSITQLGPGQVAVDFLWYERHGHIRIGAFIYASDLDCHYIPLVECDNILPTDITTRIWTVLAPILEGYRDVYFCTDGQLNDIPIEHTELADGRRIGDLTRLHRVFHLSQINGDVHLGNRIAFIGVADHNSPFKEGLDVKRGNWIDLPNVYDELNTLRHNIIPESLTVLVDDSATEEGIKALDNDMTTLHISTHGVFRSYHDLIDAIGSPACDDYHMAKRLINTGNRFLSALILRQGNLWWHSETVDAEEDDLLTAEEIELMDFPDLQLTVLSACDTGLGEIDSEGVWGLQRAFRTAGTKSLICTLNKVDDYWTAQFMEIFYQKASQGNSVYDSFHMAQSQLRDELPDNPELWSSFILIE